MYGHFAQGLTPSQMAALRRAALVAMGLPTAVPNAHALFALLDQVDPVVHIATQQLFMWLQIWNAATQPQREHLAHAWRVIAPQIRDQASNARWRSASDPMAATITTLLDWDFHPYRPDHWMGGGQSLQMNGPPDVRGQPTEQLRTSALAGCGHLITAQRRRACSMARLASFQLSRWPNSSRRRPGMRSSASFIGWSQGPTGR